MIEARKLASLAVLFTMMTRHVPVRSKQRLTLLLQILVTIISQTNPISYQIKMVDIDVFVGTAMAGCGDYFYIDWGSQICGYSEVSKKLFFESR